VVAISFRIGLGHDTHRLVAGGPLLLGGVSIDHDHHLEGHSDADVLLHAVTDALLGGAALGDIGQLFPDTEAANRDRDSAQMLAEAMRRVRAAGYLVANLDCVVLAERPRLAPHWPAIAQQIARVLDIRPDQVGLKGKTGEQVGPIGTAQAITAQCVALLQSDR